MANGRTSTITTSSKKSLFFLLVASLAALLASATTDTAGDCTAELEACVESDVCLECITLSFETSSQTDCESELVDGDSSTISQCGFTAISYCCQSETSATSTCTTDETTVAYWTCQLEVDGCDIADMPCLDSDTPAPVATEGPTTASDADNGNDDSSGAIGMMAGVSARGVLCAGVLGALATVGTFF